MFYFAVFSISTDLFRVGLYSVAQVLSSVSFLVRLLDCTATTLVACLTATFY